MSKIGAAYKEIDELPTASAGAAANILAVSQSGVENGMNLSQVATYVLSAHAQQSAPTAADAVAIGATYDATEQTTMSNMRIRINEVVSGLQALGLFA